MKAVMAIVAVAYQLVQVPALATHDTEPSAHTGYKRDRLDRFGPSA
jgi:hypothetical protein